MRRIKTKISQKLPVLPDEIWCVILDFQLHLEKVDSEQYNDWLYSSYSFTIKRYKTAF